MVGEHWEAKIADFGLSRFKDETKTMTSCGSPLWAAPEVLRGERFNEQCECVTCALCNRSPSLWPRSCSVFSYGIVMWEIAHWDEPYKVRQRKRQLTRVSCYSAQTLSRRAAGTGLAASYIWCRAGGIAPQGSSGRAAGTDQAAANDVGSRTGRSPPAERRLRSAGGGARAVALSVEQVRRAAQPSPRGCSLRVRIVQ